MKIILKAGCKISEKNGTDVALKSVRFLIMSNEKDTILHFCMFHNTP
tara:strand:+ start:819 stop:959 length:141 start_codon:yes stop_codon:yes gene_type:complete